MKGLNQNDVREFYNNIVDIWPENDIWFSYTKSQIWNYLHSYAFDADSYVLNAGSAGNTYDLPYNFHHVDIAHNQLKSVKNATIASIEDMPFKANTFDGCICVGSVINYCDAIAAISEMYRVLKPGGKIILEFENSNSFEYRKADIYGVSSGIVTVNYRQTQHKQWLYSYKYIRKICNDFNARIENVKFFHILSSLKLANGQTENSASNYAKYDKLLEYIPFIKKHAGNIIMSCRKLS